MRDVIKEDIKEAIKSERTFRLCAWNILSALGFSMKGWETRDLKEAEDLIIKEILKIWPSGEDKGGRR